MNSKSYFGGDDVTRVNGGGDNFLFYFVCYNSDRVKGLVDLGLRVKWSGQDNRLG